MEHFCDICKCSLPESALKSHINGKKHKKFIEMINRNKVGELSIFIGGFPSGTSKGELLNFISRYEKPTELILHRSGCSATLQFEKKESVCNLLSKILFYKNRKLNLRPWQIRDNVILPKEVTTSNYISSCDLLKNCDTYHEEINVIFTEIINVDYNKYHQICQDSENILKKHGFPKVIIHPFGSVITSLALKDSDIDIYVELNADINEKKIVYRIRHHFLSYQQIFTDILAISKSKVPLVKCTHKPTNTNCDFSFKNAYGVKNSQLIQYFITLDKRIRILIIIVKLWGKICHLTGPNKMSNYSLVMLVYFYLQQLKEPILPKITTLQSLASNPDIIDDWDFRFSKNNSFLPPITNNQSIRELLLGFFEYFYSFDWENKVISLLRGEILDKKVLTSADTLPEGYEALKNYYLKNSDPQFFKDGIISIQDPFVLNHNIAVMANVRYLSVFRDNCKSSIDIIKSNENDEPFLYKLFTIPDPPEFKIQTIKNINMFLVLLNPNDRDTNQPRNLFDFFVETILMIHKDLYYMEVLNIKTQSFMGEEHLISENEIPEKSQRISKLFSSTIEFKGDFLLSNQRKKLKRYIKEKLINKDFLDQEKIISQFLVKEKRFDHHCHFNLTLILELFSNYKLKFIYTNSNISKTILHSLRVTCDLVEFTLKEYLNEQLQKVEK